MLIGLTSPSPHTATASFCFRRVPPPIPLTRARGKGGLHTPAGMLIKKASGRCANTNPTDTARYTRSHMLRGFYLHHVYAPARCQPDGGLCFTYIRKERQQRQDDERRQALNAKIPPMPGGKGGMKFRCHGHMWARAEVGRRSLPLHHDTWCRFSVTL